MSSSGWKYKHWSWLIPLFAVAALTCKQYDYTSPTPGVLEVRFQTKLDDPAKSRFIPYGPLDSLGQPTTSFGVRLNELFALRADGSSLEMFADVNAIRRSSEKGDWFNCLDTLARDGSYILGQTYAPPLDYDGLSVRIAPDRDSMFIRTPGIFFPQVYFVTNPPGEVPPDLHVLRTFDNQPLSFRVEEGRTTRLTVTLDLDSALVRRIEVFEYHPYFYVSSIEIL